MTKDRVLLKPGWTLPVTGSRVRVPFWGPPRMLAGSFLVIGLIPWESGIVSALGAVSVTAAFLVVRRSGKGLGTSSSSPHACRKISVEDPRGPSLFEEKQTTRRGRCSPIAAVISNAEATAEPSEGWVVCRSMNGLCLSFEAAVEKGTVLSVRSADTLETAPWVRVKVEVCRPQEKNWELVCRFLKPPAWASVHKFFA